MSEKSRLCALGDGVPLPSPGVWICNDCTDEVDQMIREIPRLLPTLLLIARGEEQPFTLKGRPAQKQQGSQAPINVVAWSLVQDLQEAMGFTAAQYRSDPDAGEKVRQLQRDFKLAEDMVHGEAEDGPSEEYILLRLAQIPPMQPAEMQAFFGERLGIEVTVRQIYKWRTRGRLHPCNHGNPAKYWVKDVYQAWLNRRRHHWAVPYDTRTPPEGITYTRPVG